MFTGLVEETGVITKISPIGGGRKISIRASLVTEDIHTGDSINVSGVCQTVVDADKHEFTVVAIEETLKKTTFGMLKPGTKVNLERSLLPTTRLGGHFVSGHTDTRGIISLIEPLSTSYLITVQFDPVYNKNIIPVGSIAIDGISLTVAEKGDGFLKVAIIPHTWGVTSLADRKTGDAVNLEFDLLGKYILNAVPGGSKSQITESWLKEMGY